MRLLGIGAGLYALSGAWRTFVGISRFADPSNPIAFPLAATDKTALPDNVAPDSVGFFSEAVLSSAVVTWWPHAWLSIGQIADAVVHTTVAFVVLLFSVRVSRGAALDGSLSRLLYGCGFLVAVGGTLAQAASSWGFATARAEILAASRGSLLAGPANALADWTPLLAGLAIIAVGAAVRAGERARREVEGLV